MQNHFCDFSVKWLTDYKVMTKSCKIGLTLEFMLKVVTIKVGPLSPKELIFVAGDSLKLSHLNYLNKTKKF